MGASYSQEILGGSNSRGGGGREKSNWGATRGAKKIHGTHFVPGGNKKRGRSHWLNATKW